jgi:hypothetical protein
MWFYDHSYTESKNQFFFSEKKKNKKLSLALFLSFGFRSMTNRNGDVSLRGHIVSFLPNTNHASLHGRFPPMEEKVLEGVPLPQKNETNISTG